MDKDKKSDLENDLEKKLAESEKLKNEYLEGWKRERADFLNFKKEEHERFSHSAKYLKESLILKILPVIDTFSLAEKNMPEELKKDENVKGLLKTKSQLSEFLKSQGVEGIKSEGEKFDHNFHEAVECVKVDGKEPGIITEETQKGYLINKNLLRPARVKVTK